MIKVDASVAVSRPRKMVISFDNGPKMTFPLARDFARGDAIGMSSGKDDHV